MRCSSASTAGPTSKSTGRTSRSFARATSWRNWSDQEAICERSAGAGNRNPARPGLPEIHEAFQRFIRHSNEERTVVPKQLLFEDRARLKLQRGVNILADAVAVTLGPTGRNVIIDKSFG